MFHILKSKRRNHSMLIKYLVTAKWPFITTSMNSPRLTRVNFHLLVLVMMNVGGIRYLRTRAKAQIYFQSIRTETLFCKLIIIDLLKSLWPREAWPQHEGRKALFVLFLFHWQFRFKGLDIIVISRERVYPRKSQLLSLVVRDHSWWYWRLLQHLPQNSDVQ